MPEPLRKIRQRKGMSVNQLSAKSGVPAISITEYEAGRAIRSADLPRLAKALYVEEWEIEIQSRPSPKPEQETPPSAAGTSTTRPKHQAKSPRPLSRPRSPARPSQIEHLLTLVDRHFGKDKATLENEIGKPLDELTRKEASTLLKQHQQLLAESRSSGSPDEPRAQRKRAYLPEGVDQYELQYLTAQQEAAALLRFTLFDGQTMNGRIVGFSPYSITIREEKSEEEITLQKLAIAYYRVVNTTQLDEMET